MKIIVCGPPHSGKSVLVANLMKYLPTDEPIMIRASFDGEGNWSNNENQEEVRRVRKKGENSSLFFKRICQVIEKQTSKIVLVDIGGVLTQEKEQVFQSCDSFVVVSKDEKMKQKWLEFGQKLGLECIACLDSRLDGEETIEQTIPYLQGRIVGLERGKMLQNSQVIEKLTFDIIKKSKYHEKDEKEEQISEEIKIEDTQIGFELGFGKETVLEDGTRIKQVEWTNKAITKLYQTIPSKLGNNLPVNIYGVRANFVLAAICKACQLNGVSDINSYDVRLQQYIPIKKNPQKAKVIQAQGLRYHTIENKQSLFLDVDVTKEAYSLADYAMCVLPKVSKNKELYLSGRLPNWLLASIVNSYEAKSIFTFQPGKGFTCVSSEDKTKLGSIVEGINGININQYFEDKKQEAQNQSIAIIKKQGIFVNFKNWLKNLKNPVNKKYLDDTLYFPNTKPLPNTLDSIIASPVSPAEEGVRIKEKDLPEEQKEEEK